MANNLNTETLQICRTCMKELLNESLFFNLDFLHANTTELTIRQKLYDCIPELDLSIVPNAVICYECADIVNSLHKFKTECLQTEIKIHKYIQHIQQTDSVTDLLEVTQFLPESYGNLKTKLKTEAFEVIENLKADESTLCDIHTCNKAENHTDSTERKYLALQKIDMEDVLFNTNDNFITFDTSESKEISDTFNGNMAQNNISQVVNKQEDYIHNIDTPPDIIYQCHTCGHETESKLKLIVHIKSQHSETKSLLRNNEFIQRNSYIKNNKVKCGSRSYRKRNSKNQSKRKCQGLDSGNDFDKGSSSKSNVRNHKLKKPFKCLVCKYHCNKKDNLKVHMLIHTGEKPYKCSLCEFRCYKKSDVKRHMQIHTGEKPFNCSVCVYQSIRKSTLKAHMRIHTGEKPYKCSLCEFRCNKKSDVKRHMRSHTGEKPFKCSACEYRCTRKDRLDSHMQMHAKRKQ